MSTDQLSVQPSQLKPAHAQVSPHVYNRFKRLAMQAPGNLRKSADEAISEWCEKQETKGAESK